MRQRTRVNFTIPLNHGRQHLLLDENGETRPAAEAEQVEQVAEPVSAVAQPRASRRRLSLSRWQRLTAAQRVIVVATSGAFIAGLLVGLVILGWWLWPVEWTDAGFSDLAEHRQRIALLAAADLYAYDQRNQYAGALVGEWSSEAAAMACRMAAEERDVARQMRLTALVYAMNSYGCPEQQQ